MCESQIESAVLAACLLEVTARKPGNVHPLMAFDDCNWEMFCESARAIAPVLAGARHGGLGQAILQAVEATRSRVGRNTNLGMILLLAPLATANDLASSAGVQTVLQRTTVEDCRLVYEAIRLAQPGGIGSVNDADVKLVPEICLIEAMRLGSERDLVARQYINGFADVFNLSERFHAPDLPTLEREVVSSQLEQMARHPDSLISRKCGPAVAEESSARARRVREGEVGLRVLDDWLRGDGNRRNPGTTADLIAAGLFVAIQRGRVPCFTSEEIMGYGEEIRRSGLIFPWH